MATHRFVHSLVKAAILTTLLTLAASCVSAAPRGRVYVRVGPPAPIVETASSPPDRDTRGSPGSTRGTAVPTPGVPAAGSAVRAPMRAGCRRGGFTRDVTAGISSRAIGDKTFDHWDIWLSGHRTPSDQITR